MFNNRFDAALQLSTQLQQCTDNPYVIILAIPREVIVTLQKKADEVVTFITLETFFGISQFYRDFEQVSDQEAVSLLREPL